MKGKKGICLILCILLLTGLAPLRAAAVFGEPVDGVWASITLTGGANKVIFSADAEIEQQILYPDEQTDAQYLLPEGVAYDALSNTLTLTDFDAPTANLVLTMMGADFRICLSGSSRLASICSDSKGRGGSITFSGEGSLDISASENAILVRAGGAPDFVRIEPQIRLTLNAAEGSAIRVYDTALADGAISFDTSDPQVTAWDDRTVMESVTTSEGKTLELYSRSGAEGLYGIEDEIVSDSEGDRIVSNVYLLGEKDADGLYTLGEEVEHNTADISAYERVCTPHDWILVEADSGMTASRVRFSRFTVSVLSPDEGGTLSVSQTEVARGGSVEVRAVPQDGFKLTALTVNGTEVETANGVYVIGGVVADQIVAATFAAATPESITVAAPAAAAFEVPADGAEAFVSEPFTASVTDGAGDPVGASVKWSIEPETEGVSIGGDGRVTVTNAAKTAASDGLIFSVTAAVEGTEIADRSAVFSVKLAERRAAGIRLTRSGEPLGESDTILIPAAGETTTQQYGAEVFDQYGGVREEEILWSAGDWPAGVIRRDDTLIVSDECTDGSSLSVTAACASDSAVAATLTVCFAAPAAAEEDPVVPTDPEKDPAAPAAQEEAPAAPAAQEEVPAAPAAAEEDPVVPTDPEKDPVAPAAQEEIPAAPAAQEEIPAAPAAQEEAPAAPAAQEEIPAAPAAQEETPAAPAAQEEIPAAPAAQEEAPAAPAAQEEAPAAPAAQEEAPAAPAAQEEAPAAPAAQEEAPATPAAQEEAPAAAAAQEEAPAAPTAQEEASEPEETAIVPTVVWPTVLLAEDPVYGITWGELVKLGDDGSAALGEEALEGGFEINRSSSSLPDISDSFTIVFTYLDGDEIRTVESDEYAVTLARKPIDAAMVILSPAEMPYAYGEECRPGVYLRDGARNLDPNKDFTVTGYADNKEIGTGSITVEGRGNYRDAVTKNFTITPIPVSALTGSIASCRPEDESTTPAIVFKHGERQLVEGRDYDLALSYDIPARTGTATLSFKGIYSGTRILSFDLPNYLITEGAGSSWSKSSYTELVFKSNGALVKVTELTVDGKTVPAGYYSLESGSTIVRIRADYLKSLSAGKHIIGVAYKDGKALAIFSVTDVQRRGVATGDRNNATAWIVVLLASLIAFGALAFAFVRSGRKKKKKKTGRK